MYDEDGRGDVREGREVSSAVAVVERRAFTGREAELKSLKAAQELRA